MIGQSFPHELIMQHILASVAGKQAEAWFILFSFFSRKKYISVLLEPKFEWMQMKSLYYIDWNLKNITETTPKKENLLLVVLFSLGTMIPLHWKR